MNLASFSFIFFFWGGGSVDLAVEGIWVEDLLGCFMSFWLVLLFCFRAGLVWNLGFCWMFGGVLVLPDFADCVFVGFLDHQLPSGPC